jgi:hypothetical protein
VATPAMVIMMYRTMSVMVIKFQISRILIPIVFDLFIMVVVVVIVVVVIVIVIVIVIVVVVVMPLMSIMFSCHKVIEMPQ